MTKSFTAFCAISYITAVTTVTPQIMLPLVGDLAPPHKRALSLSIVVSGNLMGILIARILSGIVTNYTSWRNIYWIGLGLQYSIFTLLWLFMPDYPSTNPGGLNYFKMLWSILTLCKKHAVLVQAGMVSFCTSAAFTCYWTTLTFLLAGEPYNYNSIVIGLFALIGIAGMFVGPVYAKVIFGRFVPLVSVIIGELINLTGIIIGTYTGRFTIAGPIIQAFTLDAGMQITQIANRSAIYAIEPTGRNRVNTAFMLMSFLGQLTGTSAGNRLYAKGGWVASGSMSVGIVGCTFLICAARGPWEKGWIGWTGGWSVSRSKVGTEDGAKKGLGDVEKRSQELQLQEEKKIGDRSLRL